MKTQYELKGSRVILLGIASLSLVFAVATADAQVENSDLESIYELIKHRRYHYAEVEIGLYLDEHPQDAEAWQLLGTARQGRWDFKGAADAYQKALDLGRENAPLLRGWIETEGRSLSKISLFFNARRLKNNALRALELDPYHVETRGVLAAYYHVLPKIFGGNKRKASELVEELIELSPADGYYLLGVRAQEEDKSDSVILDHWAKALEYDDEHVATLRSLGLYSIENDSVDEAIDFYRRAIEADPNDPWIHLSYGRALRRADMYDRSAEQFEIALLADPFFAPARLNLAEFHERMENYEAAVTHYRILIRNNPTYMTGEIEKRIRELLK